MVLHSQGTSPLKGHEAGPGAFAMPEAESIASWGAGSLRDGDGQRALTALR